MLYLFLLEKHLHINQKILSKLVPELLFRLAKKYKLPIVIHCREGFNEIFEILDADPRRIKTIKIILWLADYYHHPIGEVFDTFCPPALRKITKTNTLLAIEEPIYIASSEDKVFELNKEQLNCIKEIKNLKGFDPCLFYTE